MLRVIPEGAQAVTPEALAASEVGRWAVGHGAILKAHLAQSALRPHQALGLLFEGDIGKLLIPGAVMPCACRQGALHLALVAPRFLLLDGVRAMFADVGPEGVLALKALDRARAGELVTVVIAGTTVGLMGVPIPIGGEAQA